MVHQGYKTFGLTWIPCGQIRPEVSQAENILPYSTLRLCSNSAPENLAVRVCIYNVYIIYILLYYIITIFHRRVF